MDLLSIVKSILGIINNIKINKKLDGLDENIKVTITNLKELYDILQENSAAIEINEQEIKEILTNLQNDIDKALKSLPNIEKTINDTNKVAHDINNTLNTAEMGWIFGDRTKNEKEKANLKKQLLERNKKIEQLKADKVIIENGITFSKDRKTLLRYAPIFKTNSYIIPDCIETIGEFAFASSQELTEIKILNNVKSIGDNAFRNCKSLTSITIPDSVTSIGHGAFCSCESLTSITIPDSVTSIGIWAFTLCKSLTTITVGNNNPYYKSINGNLYSKDEKTLIQYAIGKKETTFTIPKSTTSIGNCAFTLCTSLTSITIPDSVTSIGYYAFTGCTSLTSITIPDSVTSIEDRAFERCTSLTSITIPNSVTSIRDRAFDRCKFLKYNKYYNGLYLGNNNNPYVILVKTINKNITSCIINKTTKIIAYGTFYNCSSLTNITIPNSVTSIGDDAFRGCTSLTSITIPDSVTSIGSHAFLSCESLTKISYTGTKEQWEKIEKGFRVFNVPTKEVICTDGTVQL